MTLQLKDALAAIVFVTCTTGAIAQTGSVSGSVIDNVTRQPINGAQITIAGTTNGAVSKANGTFAILGIPEGQHTIEIRRIGYELLRQNIRITRGDIRGREFQLQADGTRPRVEPGVVGGTPTILPPRIEQGVATPPPASYAPGVTPPPTAPYPPGGVAPGVAHMPQPHSSMPSFENTLFPPELVMQHQRALELTADQRRTITEAVKALQNQTVDLQWNLQAEQQALVSILEKRPINEQAAVAQMSKLVELENAVKRTHLATLVRIKNALTEKQVGILNSVRRSYWDSPAPPERRDFESPPELPDWHFPTPLPPRDWNFSFDLHDWSFPPAQFNWEFAPDLRHWTLPTPPARFDFEIPSEFRWTFPTPPARRQWQE